MRRLRGVNPFEQHAEKIALGVVALVVIVAFSVQYVFQRSTVQVGNQRLAPDRAFEPVEALAQQLARRMQPSAAQTPEVPPLQLAEQFDARLAESIAPRRRLLALGRPVEFQGALAAEARLAAEGALVAAPAVPAPKQILAQSYLVTLDPMEVLAIEGLRAIAPREQPFDIAAVTVQARFDGTALERQLRDDPDGPDGPIHPLPPTWWRDAVEILDVELERREVTSAGAGQATRVPPPPGLTRLLEADSASITPAQLGERVARARRMADDVLRPPFYRLIAGPPWLTPQESRELASLASAKSAAEASLRRLAELESQLADVRARLQSGEPEPTEPTDPGRGRPGQRTRAPDEPRSPDRSRAALEQRAAVLERDIERERAALTRLGVDPARGIEALGQHDPARFQHAGPLLAADNVALWTHDLTVRRGRTYQYRIRVVTNNPLYGRSSALAAEQRELAEQPVLYSQWSEWSEPVTVEGDTYYFVVSASESDAVGPARAAVEVFRFYYGYWRRGKQTLEVGDAIATELALPDPALRPLYVLPDAPADAASPAATSPTAVTRTTEPGPLPTTPGPPSLKVALGTFLLDVAAPPRRDDGGGSGAVAFLATPTGQIEVRSPEAERRQEVYERLSRSAEQGSRQGQPEPQPPGRTPQDRPTERQPRERDRPPVTPRGPGGGGGGGGGG